MIRDAGNRIRDSALLSKGAGTAALPYSADWQTHCTLIPEPFTLNRETGAKGEVSG
ncbi:hypothetical protein OAP01_12115 [Akkermansiaceae bacterium]|nr:hypothetical protein [Akkermansiaceae bacterium]